MGTLGIGGSKLKITALGGVDAIGEKNCLLITYGQDAVLLDCGQKVGSSQPESPGDVDGISNDEAQDELDSSRDSRRRYIDEEYEMSNFPDFSRLSNLNVRSVLLTHSHKDHLGALPGLLRRHPDIVVVGSEFTLKAAREFVSRYGPGPLGFQDDCFSVSLGPFEVTRFPVLHSVPGSQGFKIRVGGKTIVYPGDIKTPGLRSADKRYKHYLDHLRSVGEAGVDFLIQDSTNIRESGYAGTEEIVREALNRIIEKESGKRIFITLISSNVARLKNIISLARRYDRKVYIAGPALTNILHLARVNGWQSLTKNSVRFLPEDAIVIVTGSQGEPNSFLGRLSRDELDFLPKEAREGGENPLVGIGDTLVMSSDPIPVPEVEKNFYPMVEDLSGMVGKIYITHDTDWFESRAAKVEREDGLHVTGHGKQNDIRDIIRIIDPKIVIPFHAELERREEMAKFVDDEFGKASVILETGREVQL